MTTRRWLGGALLAVALVGAAWWWAASDEPAPGGAPPPAPTAPAAAAPRSEPAPASRAEPLATSGQAVDAGGDLVEVVSADDGRPLPGARVGVWSPSANRGHHHWRRPAGFSGETDAAGRVEVPPQTGPNLQLSVMLDHFFPYLGPWAPGTRVVLEPIPPVQGRVLSSARTPVAGAVVTAANLPDVHAVTAADGSFSLRLPRLDRLLAEKDGATAVTPFLEEEAVLARTPLELVLAPPRVDEGRVVGRDGQPLGDVALTASVRAVTWRQVTGGDGVFRVPNLGDVQVALRFEKPGYVTVERPGFPSLDSEVVLSRPARLEGRLVDQKGRALVGETVGLLIGEAGFSMQEAVTDAEGRFVFEDLDEPEVVLEALTEDEQQTQLRVPLPEGETTRVTLALRPPLQPVSLQYVSRAGLEVFGCQATASPVPPAGWSSATEFGDTIELRRGRFHFEVRCDDGRGADETREVEPGPEAPPLRFTVSSDAGYVYEDELPTEPVLVRAVTPTGTPVEGADVECYTTRGVTGPDGRFRCEVRAGDGIWPIHVHVSKGDARGLARATGKEPEVVVVLKERVTLRGRVDGALPSGKLSVLVRSAAETEQEPLLGNSFALEGRAAIRTFVCVERFDEAKQSSETLGCAVSEAGEEVVIRLGAPGTVTFSALDRAGAPLPDPVVYVDRVGRAVESPTGAVSLELPPGEHVLVLNVDGSRARYETRFTVRPGEVTALGGLRLE